MFVFGSTLWLLVVVNATDVHEHIYKIFQVLVKVASNSICTNTYMCKGLSSPMKSYKAVFSEQEISILPLPTANYKIC